MQQHGGVRRRPTARVGVASGLPWWETNSKDSWSERLFGPDTVVEIRQTHKIEWVGKEKFLGRKKLLN
jgi:hypothetical protein